MELDPSMPLLELHPGCQGPFRDSRGKVGFLSRRLSGKGSYLSLRGESPGFPRVEAGNLGLFLNYDGDLRDSLVLPQESPVSMRFPRGFSGFLSSQCWVLGPHLELMPEPQVSSKVLTWISSLLWSFNWGVTLRLVWRHASPLSF